MTDIIPGGAPATADDADRWQAAAADPPRASRLGGDLGGPRGPLLRLPAAAGTARDRADRGHAR